MSKKKYESMSLPNLASGKRNFYQCFLYCVVVVVVVVAVMFNIKLCTLCCVGGTVYVASFGDPRFHANHFSCPLELHENALGNLNIKVAMYGAIILSFPVRFLIL